MIIKADGKTIIEISEKDKIYLKYWLPGDEGIIRFIVGAIVGKINNRKHWFFKEWDDKLMNDPNVDSIPANEEDFVNLVVSRSDYKNRVERDEEEKILKEEG